MKKYCFILSLTFFYMVLFLQEVVAQQTFTVTLLDGTAKIQRSQKKNWENVNAGDVVSDNDIVETYFQTRAILQFGSGNIIILGSNTRALLNIKEVPVDQSKIIDVNITLFSGGSLVKIVADSRASIYTSNAVGQIDSGTISTVVESKTGHTGFQILGGKAQVRNVAQQQSKPMATGLTTIVLPGKEPTAPLYITYRHVAVLKHFFGDEYIDRQIKEAGIEPTEDQSATNRLSMSQNLEADRREAESQMEKALFSQNKIWGIILDDRAKASKTLEMISRPQRVHTTKNDLSFYSSIGIAGGGVYPKFALQSSLYRPKFSLGVNLPIAKYGDGSMKMNVTSAAGIFDKIHHLTIGNIESGKYFNLGPITNYTLANGLIVNSFTNTNVYNATQPLGITMRMSNDLVDFNLFVSDVSNWYFGGLHFSLYPGNGVLGVGYYYDANQYRETITAKTSRFLDMDAVEERVVRKSPNRDSIASNAHIYEVNLGMIHELSDNIAFDIRFEFARKLAKGGVNGYVLKGPQFTLLMENINFGISYIVESGKLLEGYFSRMYPANRLRIGISNDTLYYYTQDNRLSSQRKSYGFSGFFRMKPFRGTAIDFTIRQDIITIDPFMTFVNNSQVLDTNNTNNNFQFTLSLLMNDKLLKPIKYARIYLNQIHGGFYPTTGTYFASWGFNTGLELLTAPLFLNIAFETGVNFSYIDLYDNTGVLNAPNNNIDPGDNLIDIYLGIRWGF